MEPLSTLLARLDGKRIYLDTNCFIYFLQGVEPYAPLIASLLAGAARGTMKVVTSELTIAEVLVKPYKDGRSDIAQQYRRVFAMERVIATFPVSLGVLDSAAAIRAVNGLSLADAIHIATAIDTGSAAFLTNDMRIRGPESLEIIQLSRFSATW